MTLPKASASSKSKPEASSEPLPASYEEAMDELARLVQRMEGGDMPLDALLTGYQRGAALLQFCRDKLQAVEAQIKVLDDGLVKAWKAP